ncbi:MAG: class I SAM-dependent methyltransferase [Longimicrobiales bacterium]
MSQRAADASWSPLEDALRAFRGGDASAVVLMRTDVGGTEEVPVALFFRAPEEMGPVEATALQLARGRVLDVGSGPGAHAGPLVRRGLAVTAVEILPEARAALRDAGVADVRSDVDALGPDDRFDTVLALMNGLGLCASLDELGTFLARLGGLLTAGGHILADSTDPRRWDDPEDGRYPGEVHMQLGFGGLWGEPFPFLFVDTDTLRTVAATHGLAVTVVAQEDDGRYLARITRSGPPPAP